MTISHETPVGLKKIQKYILPEIETRISCGEYLPKKRNV
jgi:hypothetical protein